ncbi:MAG TPA: sialidase family protein [Actinomycetota bacterium]
MRSRSRLVLLGGLLAAIMLIVPSATAGHAVDHPDAKVTDDNNNVDGGLENVTPSKDAQNRQANETSVAISGVASPVTGQVGDIIVDAVNDYRMVPHTADVWLGFQLSFDGGTTWFGPPPFPNGYNTFVPGFPTDTSPEGVASPLKGLDASGDPVARFDADGNLFLAGIGFNRNFDQPDRPVDTNIYVARYDFTPGTPATPSTPNKAGAPPHFSYVRTTIVERGAVGFAVPGVIGFAGKFTDKEWMEIDLNSPADSACAGSIYSSWTDFHGAFGNSPIMFSRSTDGGATFSRPRVISTGGPNGTPFNQGADIAVAPDGTIHVAYEGFDRSTGQSSIVAVKSTDCGKHWTQPVTVSPVSDPQAPGVAFRTPTFGFLAVDDSDPAIVYAGYQSFEGDYDIYVRRSTDAGSTWGPAVQVNEDPGARHQIFPTIEVSNGALHVAWYDFRNSVTPINEALDVYYACTNCGGVAYPTFSHNVRVSDVSHNPECRMFGGGSVAFHGDYIELDARFDGVNHQVAVAWADNRDVPAAQCDLDPAPGPPSNNIGNRNQNIYASTLTVSP